MDFLLKQRLVGAVVLVALGVIFIPMLLEGPDDTLVPKMEELPELTDLRSGEPLESLPPAGVVSDEPATSVVIADAVPEPVPEQAQAAPEAAPGGPAGASEKPAENEAKASPAPEIVPEPHAGKPVTEPGPLGSWVVQAGSFSSQQNALVLRDKLRKAGFATQVEKVQVDSKTHYRVRVGPFLERAEADRSQRQLSDKFSLAARVLSYP